MAFRSRGIGTRHRSAGIAGGRDRILGQLIAGFDEDFARLGLPRPEKNDEAPDLVLMTGPGYSFAETMNIGAVGAAGGGLKGNHGHDPAPDYMHATFVAAGTGIKPGVRLDQINNVDVAPTIARLMGLALTDVDGRVLDEILAK